MGSFAFPDNFVLLSFLYIHSELPFFFFSQFIFNFLMQNDTCDEAIDVVNSFLLGATHGDSNVLC